MTEPTSLTERRWRNAPSNPGEHPAIEAIEVATARIAAMDAPAQHIIVVWANVDETGAADIDFVQAGTLDVLAQIGLLDLIKDTIRR